jgi:hypothetical protein
MTSVPPPADTGTISWMGRCGKIWALADDSRLSPSTRPVKRYESGLMVSPDFLFPDNTGNLQWHISVKGDLNSL